MGSARLERLIEELEKAQESKADEGYYRGPTCDFSALRDQLAEIDRKREAREAAEAAIEPQDREKREAEAERKRLLAEEQARARIAKERFEQALKEREGRYEERIGPYRGRLDFEGIPMDDRHSRFEPSVT